jgi:hypothetical protein
MSNELLEAYELNSQGIIEAREGLGRLKKLIAGPGANIEILMDAHAKVKQLIAEFEEDRKEIVDSVPDEVITQVLSG